MTRREFLVTTGVAAAAGAGALGAQAGGAAEAGKGAPPSGSGAAGPDKRYVTPCGVYCRLCEWNTRIPEHAKALLEWLAKAEAGVGKETREQLEKWANPPADKYCRSGKCGGKCAFKACTARKGVFTCPECQEYPCQKVKTFARSEPTLIHDGERMRQLGVDKWIAEQEARRAAGFCYADVRCLPSALRDVRD